MPQTEAPEDLEAFLNSLEKLVQATRAAMAGPGSRPAPGSAEKKTRESMAVQRTAAAAKRVQQFRRNDAGLVLTVLRRELGHDAPSDRQHEAATNLALQWRELEAAGVRTSQASFIEHGLRRAGMCR